LSLNLLDGLIGKLTGKRLSIFERLGVVDPRHECAQEVAWLYSRLEPAIIEHFGRPTHEGVTPDDMLDHIIANRPPWHLEYWGAGLPVDWEGARA
jgi:hypothetical protein